ncbi:hypothetical protein DFH07DRAFT_1005076 [Mycena maculata]|uniref:Uncharacterized protein n=1 Tax=Mycena maculata TaxID=230809 RepID=A0AAD7HN92_9AGAR|nr:hypothetical protein DFH07DRAFT_1005076 [Mycena maculata]
MATIVERPVAPFSMSPSMVPRRRTREPIEVIDVDSLEDVGPRPTQRRRMEQAHDVIELLDSDDEAGGDVGSAGAGGAGARRFVSPLPPGAGNYWIPPVPPIPRRYSSLTSLVPRPRGPRVSPPPSSNLNLTVDEASSSYGSRVPGPIRPISRVFPFEHSPSLSPPPPAPHRHIPSRLEDEDFDFRPAPPARHNPPMGLGGALISSNNARVRAERLERQHRSERRAAGGRVAPLAALTAGDGRSQQRHLPPRSILSRLRDINPFRWGDNPHHNDVDFLALAPAADGGDERTRGDAQLALDLYLADQEDAMYARFTHPARGFAQRELALLRGWVGGAGKDDEDYKKEWTHPGTADGGFVFDFAPSELVPAVSGKGKGKEVVIDVDAEKEETSTLLVCARCLDPLLVRADGMTEEEEARRRKVWGLRCGHLIDGKCFEELRKPVEEEPVAGPSGTDAPEPSPEPKGKGKGKAREVADDDEEFDELFDEHPLHNSIRSRLRPRTGASGSHPGSSAFELAVPSPRPAKRAPPKRKSKAKPKKPVVQARYEWACPVAGCARVHLSEKIEGVWVNAPQKGAIGVFV